MADIVNDHFLDRFTNKWNGKIEPYVDYPSLTTTTPAEVMDYILVMVSIISYQDFDPNFYSQTLFRISFTNQGSLCRIIH